jgi:hypothetical protein
MEKPNEFKLLAENLKQNGRELLRLWLIVLGIHLISLILGFAIFLIIFGVQLILRRIIITWVPARRWFAKTFAITITENTASNVSSQYASFLSKFHFFIALVHVIVGLYMIAVGVGIFLRDGFLGQNFIYLIFTR